jgi:hypothetical protein
LTFANEDLQNDYNTKTNKIEEYYKGNPQIDYTNPDSIKQLMNLYNPLMKDNELIANYKYDKSVRTEAQKVNELRRTNDKSYNAINDAVFQNEYSEYTKANKKDVAKLYRFFDIERSLLPTTRSCENDNHIESHCGNCWWCHERIWAFGNLGE